MNTQTVAPTTTTIQPSLNPRFHPLVAIFDPMEGEAWTEFVADIKLNGVREPVTVYKNQVLDGRNRWLACEQLKITCPQRVYEGKESDLLAFVVSKNYHRRNQDPSQRAMSAARIANISHGGDRKSDQGPNLALDQRSIDNASKLMHVSTGNVKNAKRVIAKGEPELVKAVGQGKDKIAVSAAAKIAEQPPEVQRQAVMKVAAGAKAADVVRALPPSSGKAKRPSAAAQRQQREEKHGGVINIAVAAKKPPTAAMKKTAHDLWLFMLVAEEWTSEEPSELWPLLDSGQQVAVGRAAKALGPWLIDLELEANSEEVRKGRE